MQSSNTHMRNWHLNSRISGSWTRLALSQQSCLWQESSLTCLNKTSQAQFITTYSVPGIKSGNTKPLFIMTGFLNDEDHIPTKGLKIHNHIFYHDSGFIHSFQNHGILPPNRYLVKWPVLLVLNTTSHNL